MALEITDENIDQILNENDLVVIDFWASWCGPCRMLGPIIDELASENTDVKIGKVNVTDNNFSATKYSVTSIPTVLFMKNGKEIHRQRGVLPKKALQELIENFKN
jgi:thioredoxin 1